jgi:hypothetical protein
MAIGSSIFPSAFQIEQFPVFLMHLALLLATHELSFSMDSRRFVFAIRNSRDYGQDKEQVLCNQPQRFGGREGARTPDPLLAKQIGPKH